MKIAALYDIHGNLPALEAILADVQRVGVDEIVVGGDVVPGPMPAECLERLAHLDMPVRYISGNGEREILLRRRGETSPMPPGYEPMMRWVADQLEPSHEKLISAFPLTSRVSVPELGDILFCHASPRNDMDIFTRLTPEAMLLPIIEPARADVVVCGHTHMPFDRYVGSTRLVNAGSVGMPFDGPGAAWLLIGPTIELRNTRYDLDAAAKAILATAYSGADDFARNHILTQPGEQTMLAVYANAQLVSQPGS